MDTTGEICVAPLSEGSLFLEILLHRSEILLLQSLVVTLISRLERSIVIIIISCLYLLRVS